MSANTPPPVIKKNAQHFRTDILDSNIFPKKSTSYSDNIPRTSNSGNIPYREKRNPLTNTRLSCYQPAVNTRNLLSCKSVEDFMHLNAVEGDTTMEREISKNSLKEFTHQRKYTNHSDDLNTSSDISSMPKEHVRLLSSQTKSLENILDEQNYDSLAQKPDRIHSNRRKSNSSISDKIKTMSNKTQKMFCRLYNSHVNRESQKTNSEGTLLCENQSSSKSRKSLSYGHLPDIDKFRKYNNLIDQNNSDVIERTTGNHRKLDDFPLACRDMGDDTDSGILVNESGQSSIIETVNEQNSPKNSVHNVFQNNTGNWKHVKIHIRSRDLQNGLKIKLVSKCYGLNDISEIRYYVDAIEPGGTIDR